MKKKLRYAVVGLGHIAQTAMLPAFKHASANSELTALISGDPVKLKDLGKKYGVPNLFSYDEYEACLRSGLIDAVYIAVPNTEHLKFALPAMRAGIHVLCEKPMAPDERSCQEMIDTAKKFKVKLMVAYRLHFEAANLHAIEIAKSNKLGRLKIFNSIFTMQVRDRNNIRLRKDMGGGPLLDIGIYCINAARYLFRAEPIEVFAMAANSEDSRFKEVDETISAILRYPDDRLASFTASFGAADNATYDLIGTTGSLRLENAYDYAMPITLHVTKDEKTKQKAFAKHDQFAAELIYFSDCVLNNLSVEPSGLEGLADTKVIQALAKSAHLGASVSLANTPQKTRPDIRQKIMRPPIKHSPREIHTQSPSKH